MLRDVKGEQPVTHPTYGKWEYLYDTSAGIHVYYHATCDVLADHKSGRCIMCGCPSPILWNTPECLNN